ncbi:MAG: plasmid replication protein, CyRepA1 family, partial [Tumebacillaceae bacterium]
MINKNEANDKSLFVDGWENVAVSSETLASHINNGIAYCAQLSGPRKAANFLETNFLSVDIDGTRRIDDVMRDTIVQNYLTIFCTTPSHTDAEHRLRLGFALPRFICTAVDAVAANRSLALHLSGDRAATDATRIFYGSRGSRPLVFDRRINEQFLADLIAQGKDTDQRDSVGSDSSHATTASAKEVHLDHVVVTEGGAERPFKLLSAGTRVFCPFHYDRSPSAFVTVSKRGVTGLHCSTCAQTFWPPGTDPAKFDFYDFDKQV